MSLTVLKTSDRPPVLTTRLRPTALPPGIVERTGLVARIVASPAPVIAICAPAGAGKTTLLAQVASALDVPVAWLTLDDRDNDPTQLLTEIATAIDHVVPIDPRVFDDLRSPEPAIGHQVLVRLLNSLARDPPLVLILDGLQVVRGQHSLEALRVLCDHLPAGVRVVVASAETPTLPIARLRAHGALLELGPADLALSPVEARLLLELARVRLDADVFERLYERTEGWATGLYLATLSARASANPNRAIRQFGGDDSAVFEYMSSELLDQQPPEHLAFLLHTSVLDRFSAPLCNAVLDRGDAAQVLVELEKSTGFLVPLDRRREWFRFQHLFRDVLHAALTRSEPRLAGRLHERASRWHEEHDLPAEAIEHALAAEDRRRAAALLARNVRPLFNAGHQVTIRRWLQAFSDADLTEHPPLAAAGAWITGLLGERAEARRYIEILERSTCTGPFPLGESNSRSAAALLHAAFPWNGVSQMHTQAELAAHLEPPGSAAHERAALYLGLNLFLRGRNAAAADRLQEAATLGPAGANTTMCALGAQALIDLEANRFDDAAAHVSAGLELFDELALDGYTASGPLLAARACLDVERGDRAAARSSLELVIALLPRTTAIPWLSILLGILCGRVALAIDDVPLAESLLVQSRRELSRYPDAGMLPHLLTREERALEAARGGAGHLIEPLTEAELRVLELAPTHLTLEEIGRNLGISRNTVKTHLKVIYSKLNVGSRGEAVERAHVIGLIGRR